MLEITAAQRRSLRSRAHALKPVVSISQNGLSDSVLAEIGRSLDSHELIKIRVYNDDRDERERLNETICQQLAAAPRGSRRGGAAAGRGGPVLERRLLRRVEREGGAVRVAARVSAAPDRAADGVATDGRLATAWEGRVEGAARTG